ncbi:MAG: hypothetical protein ABWY96_02620 [Gaiellaceae bacterium]|jgi:hypothetical protein
MPSRKQRRKREKLQRHEYEYVIETEDGEEILERPPEVEATEKNGKPRKAVAGPVDRHGKPIAKPSFRRVLRRTAIFGPLIAIFIYITGEGLSPAGLVLNVLLLLAFFMPLSYVVDTVVYRMLWRRYEKSRES